MNLVFSYLVIGLVVATILALTTKNFTARMFPVFVVFFPIVLVAVIFMVITAKNSIAGSDMDKNKL